MNSPVWKLTKSSPFKSIRDQEFASTFKIRTQLVKTNSWTIRLVGLREIIFEESPNSKNVAWEAWKRGKSLWRFQFAEYMATGARVHGGWMTEVWVGGFANNCPKWEIPESRMDAGVGVFGQGKSERGYDFLEKAELWARVADFRWRWKHRATLGMILSNCWRSVGGFAQRGGTATGVGWLLQREVGELEVGNEN